MINYKVASNSHIVKMAFLKMLGAIRGHHQGTLQQGDRIARAPEAPPQIGGKGCSFDLKVFRNLRAANCYSIVPAWGAAETVNGDAF